MIKKNDFAKVTSTPFREAAISDAASGLVRLHFHVRQELSDFEFLYDFKFEIWGEAVI